MGDPLGISRTHSVKPIIALSKVLEGATPLIHETGWMFAKEVYTR